MKIAAILIIAAIGCAILDTHYGYPIWLYILRFIAVIFLIFLPWLLIAYFDGRSRRSKRLTISHQRPEQEMDSKS